MTTPFVTASTLMRNAQRLGDSISKDISNCPRHNADATCSDCLAMKSVIASLDDEVETKQETIAKTHLRSVTFAISSSGVGELVKDLEAILPVLNLLSMKAYQKMIFKINISVSVPVTPDGSKHTLPDDYDYRRHYGGPSPCMSTGVKQEQGKQEKQSKKRQRVSTCCQSQKDQ